ncbi:hypothetical protein [Streptomyces sp. NPDC005953]|uniref:hypothetical protein n=1 Tax=Streptomyces sp. NPDC005953 TaxID=3156719 RepID=UPI0033FB2260
MSAYVEALIQRQLERDLLRELIEDAEAEPGPVDLAAASPSGRSSAVMRTARRAWREREARPGLRGVGRTRTTFPLKSPG